jgi:hypothetical protein
MSSFRCRSISRQLASLILLLAGSASLAAAQGREALSQPEMVPIDLVTALVQAAGVPGPTTPRILVGSAPGWVIPRIVVPNGGRIVGSAFQGTAVLTIVNVPAPGDSVIEQIRQALLAHGWKVPPPLPQFASYGGGFRAAPATPAGMPVDRTTLCDDEQALTTSLVRRDAKSADIAYRIFQVTGVGSVCKPMQYPQPSIMRLPMPTLYNPVGSQDARGMIECSTNIAGSSGTGTTLRTAMAPEAILDHYASQLTDSGWKSGGDRGNTVIRTFSRADSTGAPIEVSITIATSPRSELCHEVNMQVRSLRKP